MLFHQTWTEFDLDVDKFIVYETDLEKAHDILRSGFFSYPAGNNTSPKDILFIQNMREGLENRVYFLKPAKPFLKEQRGKGYRLEYGPHERGEKFFSVGPLKRMDGSGEDLTKTCSIQADDCMVLHTLSEGGFLESAILNGDREGQAVLDLEDFAGSAMRAVHETKKRLWGEHYRALRSILVKGEPLTNDNLQKMLEHLPIEMKNMNGVPQNFGHLGLDPLQHSIIAIQVTVESSTFHELADISMWGEAMGDELARCAILYHDLGKKVDSFDPYHAELSGHMSEFHFECMGYTPHETAVLKRLVETHDIMGGIKKGEFSCLQGFQTLCRDLPKTVSREAMVKLHCEVAGADIASIPYLRGISLAKEREEMLALAKREEAE